MLKEIRAKRLKAQGTKARKGENPRKRKGKEMPKQKSRKIISLSNRKRAAVKLFPKAVQQTELASLNLRDDVNDDIAECENKARNFVQGYLHFVC
jgi:hypothetical protein